MAIFGCIADDFTGASDMASFLVKGGMRTQLFNGVPDGPLTSSADGLVISLKTRTQETASAVRDSLAALNWLKGQGCTHFYIKYCSTFDSTPAGNIGPICDAALDWLQEKHTVLCPALPVNGRTVREGRLYVNGVPLDESPMRNHPVTPMWDSDLRKLMGPQSRYAVYREKDVPSFADAPYYVVPDCEKDDDLTAIAAKYGDWPLLTGGSGLAAPLARLLTQGERQYLIHNETAGPAVILAGSCSEQTRRQIAQYREAGRPCYYLDPVRLLRGEETVEALLQWVLAHPYTAPLIYSSGDPEQVAQAQRYGKEKISALLESAMAELAARCVQAGVTRIIVAGGETSGAVSKRLGFTSYIIGNSIAPGVPIMMPTERSDIRLVLKSGNFGGEDFFMRAVGMTGGGCNAQ
ncbi:MAG: four-carbon acid sugar kinase family protein [Clostridia bacterium]|nr:four-carbon acid sugar kinase family protein [Clostridia bacterium]